MEEACCMRMETVTHGSHCFDLMCSGTSLCHANGQCYAWFALFRAEVKWNRLVECEWTLLRVAPKVCGWDKVKQSLLHTIGHRYACFTLFGAAKSGGSLLHANGHRYASFPLFRAETKWKKLVTWKWTQLRVVCTVSS